MSHTRRSSSCSSRSRSLGGGEGPHGRADHERDPVAAFAAVLPAGAGRRAARSPGVAYQTAAAPTARTPTFRDWASRARRLLVPPSATHRARLMVDRPPAL